LHAGHGTGGDDDAAGERRWNATACDDDAEDPGGSRTYRSGDLESSGNS
jgi:hypothetical protein